MTQDVKAIRAASEAKWAEFLKIVQGRAVRYGGARHKELYGALAKMREAGTLIVPLKDGRWGLRPEIGPGKWKDQEQYNRQRDRLLRPYHEELVECLGELVERGRAGGEAGGSGSEDGRGLGAFADSEQVVKVKDALERKGYCAVRSGVLGGEVVYFARGKVDAEIVAKRYPDAACYTVAELDYLTREGPLGAEDLKVIHGWKRELKGQYGKGSVPFKEGEAGD